MSIKDKLLGCSSERMMEIYLEENKRLDNQRKLLQSQYDELREMRTIIKRQLSKEKKK